MKNSRSVYSTVLNRWNYSSLLFLGATFAGATTAAFPLLLLEFGYSKPAVAIFFCINPLIAVLYNLVGMRWVARAGYPPMLLVITCLCVPTGTALMTLSGGNVFILYLGSALMVTTSTVLPQVFGRMAAATSGDTQDLLIAALRQLQVAGYITGLGAFALFGTINVDPTLGAAAISILAALIAMTVVKDARRLPDRNTPDASAASQIGTSAASSPSWTSGILIALIIVALLKSADAMRAVYLPLYTAMTGFTAADISLLLIIVAIIEFAVLPAVGRGGQRFGNYKMIALISVLGSISFLILMISEERPWIYASQVFFAMFAAGFQSIGLAMLARLLPGGAGQGAAVFQAVIQLGAILGVTLPLLLPGYSSSIFAVAFLACILAATLSALLSRSRRHAPDLQDSDKVEQ
ncbi:MFS transporter [Nocardiopsis dassonvillei]|uniref:MFS transporter n=1 Tax=Nocardiopsis dassonvillei TaxID=2014 RepID=UPI00366DD83D